MIAREGAGYKIGVDADTFDSLDFESRIAAARALSATDPAGAAATIRRALGLWRGAPFDDVGGREALDAEVARLAELRLAAVEEMMQARLAAGQHGEVVAELERLTREHPYREELRALHMVALYRSGRQADALRAYQATRDVLDEDLGIVPSPQTAPTRGADPAAGPGPRRAAGSTTPGRANDRWIENPYLGLRAFREADHARFFGQEQLVERLVERVIGTARVSPQSSGRAVRASRAPCRRAWSRDCDATIPTIAIALMQPGAQPFAALERRARRQIAAATRLASFAVELARTGRAARVRCRDRSR